MRARAAGMWLAALALASSANATTILKTTPFLETLSYMRKHDIKRACVVIVVRSSDGESFELARDTGDAGLDRIILERFPSYWVEKKNTLFRDMKPSVDGSIVVPLKLENADGKRELCVANEAHPAEAEH